MPSLPKAEFEKEGSCALHHPNFRFSRNFRRTDPLQARSAQNNLHYSKSSLPVITALPKPPDIAAQPPESCRNPQRRVDDLKPLLSKNLS